MEKRLLDDLAVALHVRLHNGDWGSESYRAIRETLDIAYNAGRERGVEVGREITATYGRPLFE